ncbi:MAG: hypothetical protein IK066_04600 [Kiritimatiellae bacterium]|nr:hypothetical protein [Kiritimatiellia bacterium]
MLGKLIGGLIAVVLGAATVYAVVKITESYLRQKALEEARRRCEQDALAFKIKQLRSSGQYTKVSIGLLDGDFRQMGRDITWQEEGQPSGDLREGQILALYD